MAKQSTKLSEYHRRHICENLLFSRFSKEKLAIKEGFTALGELIFHHVWDNTAQKKMNALPDGWLPSVKNIKARIGGVDAEFTLRKSRRVPYEKYSASYDGGCTNHIYNSPVKDCPFVESFTALRDRHSLCHSQEIQAKSEINGILNSATTTGKLISIWPEIKTIVEEICCVSPPTLLPAPQLQKLNAFLGLKPAA